MKYEVNGRNVSFKVHKFSGKFDFEYYENQVYRALNKIGVSKDKVLVSVLNDDECNVGVEVRWDINGKVFSFRSVTQESVKENMGAIAQAIQDDVRQITRGIKDLFGLMKQYEDVSIGRKKSNLLQYGSSEDGKDVFSNVKRLNKSFEFLSRGHALRRKSEILSQYECYSTMANIPEGVDKEELRQVEEYLGNEVRF